MAKGIIKLGTDSRGNYQRDIGWEEKASGKIGQHRFYFGTNQTTAQIRCLAVLRCWDAVEARWGRPAPEYRTERPLWDRLTVAVAVAVAAGQEEYPLEPEACPASYFEDLPFLDDKDTKAAALLRWFRELQQDFQMIRFRQVGNWPMEAIDRMRRSTRNMAEDMLRSVEEPVVCVGQTLHQALDAFSEWHGQQYRTTDGGISQHGAVCQKQLTVIKEHAPNTALEAFGLEEIEALIRYWQQRPTSKAYARKGQPISRETAKNFIKRIRHFVRWLHRSTAFKWRKPEDYEVEAVRIRPTAAEKSRKLSATQVKTYSPDELATLWKYASPRERLLMVLALNCGFGQAEVASLQQAEVFLNQPHGYYPVSGSFIKAVRLKSGVYGEWRCWEETERALAWWATQRPDTAETALLTTKTGTALSVPTKGHNRNGRIANAWVGLTKRIQKDVPTFPKLSYNKLRKTAASLIRQAADGEIAGVFLCHGQPVKSDDLAELYSDRPFNKVFDALETVRRKLAHVFDAVADPFPTDGRKRNPSISLSVRERIVSLRREGKEYKEIARACDVSIDTVRRYLTDAGMVRRYKRAKS